MNRIALVSDIHGNLPALQAVIAHLHTQAVDAVINLGDHLSGPLWPAETADLLMRTDWLHIRGNHDRQLVELEPRQHNLSDQYTYQHINKTVLDWLRSMPATLRMENFFAFHGAPGDDHAYLLEEMIGGRMRLSAPAQIRKLIGNTTNAILLCGHTHIPRVVQVDDDVLIINPGSVGLPAYEDDTPMVHISESGSPHARYAIMEKLHEQWVVQLIAIPYNHKDAADQAARNYRPEWAKALRNGFMRGSIDESPKL